MSLVLTAPTFFTIHLSFGHMLAQKNMSLQDELCNVEFFTENTVYPC